MIKSHTLVIASLLNLFSGVASADPVLQTSAGAIRITQMAANLDVPWGFGFLPDGSVILTERDGELLHISDSGTQKIKGAPRVAAKGQGGLLDVLVPRDFATTREVLFTLSRRTRGGYGTAVVSARLNADHTQLSNQRVLYQAPGTAGGRHFGSRLREGPDGHLFVTLGDRGDAAQAQNIGLPPGSILRLTRSGQVASDNPFAKIPDAVPHIWSFGHRNPQGLAFDPSGQLWAVEHGAKGGDEINQIHKGANYGWPVISYGTHYSGATIGEGVAKSGLEQPEWYWDPSIAPSGMMIYSGKMWPSWTGDVFIGSLKFDYIARLSGTPLIEVEQLTSPQTGRIRDVREAPDGSIWFASEGQGALYRMSPETD